MHYPAPWKVGQHFYLCFTEGSIWQSNPFTHLVLPARDSGRQSYVIRAKKGKTRRIAALIGAKLAAAATAGSGEKKHSADSRATTSVILQGPYGEDVTDALEPDANVLCVAGGTGITYVMPVLLTLVRRWPVPGRKIDFVWTVKRERDLEQVAPELNEV